MNPLLQYAVWAKAKDHPWIQGAKIDDYGNPMKLDHYGKVDSLYGWEVDHYPVPKALGGPDELSNLRALNCKRNRSHGGLLAEALRRMGDNPFQAPAPPRGMFGRRRP